MPLTDTTIRNAKPGDKPRKLADGKGLFVLINPNGSKYWRFKYRYGGKEKLLALGVYPDISLSEARKRLDEARRLLENNTDPSFIRSVNKHSSKQSAENTFEAIAREWHTKMISVWAPTTAKRIIRSLEKDVFPWLGNHPIKEITAPNLLASLRKVESRGALEMAHRIREMTGQVFRYAIATGRAERDPSVDLRGALPPVKVKHHASLTEPNQIGALLRAIKGFSGSFVTRCALQLAPLVFVRPGELRHAEWKEVDLENTEWRIPDFKMKMKSQHIVPLSHQAIQILLAIQPLTSHGRYIFPGLRSHDRPMSENTINGALRRLGYEKGEMTGHGFRSIASTLLHEKGWPHDAIERQLAHAERNAITAAYNYAEHLPKRREMMQWWSDYLEGLEKGADVVPLFKKMP